MIDENLVLAIEWYENTIVRSTEENHMKIHADMWRSWLDKMGISHIRNEVDFTFNDDYTFKPSIIIPDFELVYATHDISEYACYTEGSPITHVPLFIDFECYRDDSNDCESLDSVSHSGWAVMYTPTLPFNVDKTKSHSTHETKSLPSIPLTYKLSKFSNSSFIYSDEPFSWVSKMFLAGVKSEGLPLQSRINEGVLGTAFLVSDAKLLEIQETKNSSFKFDIGMNLANAVVLEFYERLQKQ